MKKDEIIAELTATRRELLDAASALPKADQDTVFLGTWTVKDFGGAGSAAGSDGA